MVCVTQNAIVGYSGYNPVIQCQVCCMIPGKFTLSRPAAYCHCVGLKQRLTSRADLRPAAQKP